MPRRALAVVVAVMVALLSLWWLGSQHGRGDAGGSSPVATAPVEPLAVAAARQQAASERDAADPVREPTPEPAAAATQAAAGAVIRGRTVDGDGRPLAGCTVKLRGSTGNTQRMDAYRREHGEVVWTNPPPHTTDADGRLELRVPPGRYPVKVVPERLLSQEARQEYQRQHPDVPSAWQRELVLLGTVEVPGGGATEVVELRLPADAGY